ncbi:MAG: asparaginase [Myxococcales bacterium]|nr:asparaginase [Myxococcales bacterium]MDP3505274.1 asparaginase [Myxococcales bacterium]
MRRLLLVHTGGTLGMSGRRPHALKPGAFIRTVRQRVPELTKLAQLEFELFSNLDSCEMQPELWTRLATLLHERLDDFDGAVITHGTDTLSDTASALSFMLKNLDKPVVLTGAQRPLGEVRSDARLNLIDAVTAALHGPKEVTVCFDSHLFRGNRVRKVSIAEYDAFDSPNFPVLGVLGVEARFQPGLARKGRRMLWPKVVPEVFLLRIFPGLDPALVLPMLPHLKGLVVEAYGAGNFPVSKALGRSLEPVFSEAQRLKIPVVVVSQAHRNGVDLSLYESGSLARSYGAISGGDLTMSAAVVKLMHGLAHVAPRGLRAYLERSVAGERS